MKKGSERFLNGLVIANGIPTKRGIPYGYLLNWVFIYFEVSFRMGVPGTVKKMFSSSTLHDCECIEREAPGRSQVAAVLEQQATLKREVDNPTILLVVKMFEVVTLKSEL